MASRGAGLGGRPAPAYLPALDGLRAVSILLVVVSHLGLGQVVPGAFGVTLFFFISGYLITRQLLASLAATGRIDLPGFYARRVARLLPASLVYVVVAGTAFSLAGGRITPAGWLAALFYGANYYDLWGHYHSTLPGVRHPFNVLWSLAIEEHFYAVWPAVLLLIGRWRGAVPAIVAACLAVLAWRLWLLGACDAGGGAPWVCGPENPNPLWRHNRLYLTTDARCDSILWGCVLAFFEARGVAWRGRAGLGLVLLALAFAWPGAVGRFGWRPSLQGVALLLLVPLVLRREGVLSSAPAVYVGRLSYSLYLWHVGALGLADFLAPAHGAVWLAIAVPGAAAFAAISYHGVELPMLAVRRRLGSHAPGKVSFCFEKKNQKTLVPSEAARSRSQR